MRIYIFIAIFVSSIFAQSLPRNTSTTYSISFGIFGEIARAYAKLEVKKDLSYVISMRAHTSGMAYVLAGKREEFFRSEGFLKNGFFVPEVFFHKVKKQYKDSDNPFSIRKKTITKIDEKTYTFNHDEKSVYCKKDYTRNENVEKNKPEKLEFYADNDLLSLFFNFGRLKKNSKSFKLYAVGANKKDGRVDVFIPSGKKLKQIKEDLEQSVGDFLIVYINQKIFSSDKGELFINMQNGICESAILKDVLLFGDIKGVRIK